MSDHSEADRNSPPWGLENPADDGEPYPPDGDAFSPGHHDEGTEDEDEVLDMEIDIHVGDYEDDVENDSDFRDEPDDEDDEDDEEDDEDGDGDGDDDVIGQDDFEEEEPHFPFRFVVGNDEGQDIAATRLVALLRAGQRSGLLTRQQQLLDLFRTSELGIERRPKDPNRFPKVPSLEGAKLMHSGVFGANHPDSRKKRHVSRLLLDRELGIGPPDERRRNNQLLAQSLIPSSKPEKIIHYESPVYSGQFSDDGNFFFSCCQDFNVRMYDTSNPYQWKHYKTAHYPFGQWTLTDASLSPDNRWLAYTSIQSTVSITPTDPLDTGDPYSLELDNGEGARRLSWWQSRGSFGIWSVRFSGDGRELVAGTSAHSIVVYDIESRRVLHHIEGHEDDVNAVCFADKSSPHIIYSGSDDTVIKVWDRRSMGDRREVGAFVGHIEGLTYIDSKGDGRYILSNGKDQSMKLWDLRRALSTDRLTDISSSLDNRLGHFDYRGEEYDENDWYPHPHDNSVVTFRGHKVLRTLIRCHFSPPSSTNSRYVYSGSADGKVYIWNLDATLAGVIDVKKATRGTRQFDNRRRMYFEEPGGWSTCVRDASWHPHAPVLVASAWNGYSMARGTCTVHSYNSSPDDDGDGTMGLSLDDMLRPKPGILSPSPMRGTDDGDLSL